LITLEPIDGAAVELNGPTVGRQSTGDQIHCGGFAGPVGAEQGHHLAGPKTQAELVHGNETSEATHDVSELQEWFAHEGSPFLRSRLISPLGTR
jgi:hypothetical protein